MILLDKAKNILSNDNCIGNGWYGKVVSLKQKNMCKKIMKIRDENIKPSLEDFLFSKGKS